MKNQAVKKLSLSLLLTIASASGWTEAIIEEVVVTANFRQAELMKSTGSITAVGAPAIDNRSARHLEQVLQLAPNVSYASGASRGRFIQVRGVGELEQFVDPKHFPSVGITLDGIELAGTANAAMLMDVDQVEILRGPQGTRFGSSALAGMVNISSNAPADHLQGNIEAGVGNYGSWHAGTVVSGPLADNLSGRLAVQKNYGDGYIENDFLNRDDTNGYDEFSARGKLHWQTSPGTSYELTALYFDSDNGYDAWSLQNTRHTISDQPGHDRQRTKALSLSGEWTLSEDWLLESVASWSDNDSDYGYDEDWTYAGYCGCGPESWNYYVNTDNYRRDRDNATLDIRLLSPDRNELAGESQYVVGLYLQRRSESLHRTWWGYDFFSDYESDRSALYGQFRKPFSDRFTLVAGYRYEWFSDDYDDSNGLLTDSDDSFWSGELTLEYMPSDNTLLYATLSRGAKPGGVNTEASSSFPLMGSQFQDFITPRLKFDAETLVNAEMGLKGGYLDNRLDLRIALFYMDRSNAQLESWMYDAENFLWIGFLDSNSDADNYGLEVEGSYLLTDAVVLSASLGLLETSVDSLQVYDLDAWAFRALEDRDQARAPGYQYHLGVNWQLNQGLNLNIEMEGRGESYFGYYHDRKIDSYRAINASLAYEFDSFSVQLWGRNLLDDDYAVHGLYFGNDPLKGWINERYLQWGEPRVFGVTARYNF